MRMTSTAMAEALEKLLATFIHEFECVITRLHKPFMVDDEMVLWADVAFKDDPTSRYKGLTFISRSVKVHFSVEDESLYVTDFYRIDTTGAPRRGFATACFKECIRVAAEHVGATKISLEASGMLKTDQELEARLLEYWGAVDLSTLFAHAMQIPAYNMELDSERAGDCDFINLAVTFVVQRLINARLEAYYMKLGFRLRHPYAGDISAYMDMEVVKEAPRLRRSKRKFVRTTE